MSHRAFNLQPVFRGRKTDADIASITSVSGKADQSSSVVVADARNLLTVWRQDTTPSVSQQIAVDDGPHYARHHQLQLKASQQIVQLQSQRLDSVTAGKSAADTYSWTEDGLLFVLQQYTCKVYLLPNLVHLHTLPVASPQTTRPHTKQAADRCIACATTVLTAASSEHSIHGLLAVATTTQLLLYGYKLSYNKESKQVSLEFQQLQQLAIDHVHSLSWYAPSYIAGSTFPFLVATTSVNYFILSGDSSQMQDVVIPHTCRYPVACVVDDEQWLTMEESVLMRYDLRRAASHTSDNAVQQQSNSTRDNPLTPAQLPVTLATDDRKHQLSFPAAISSYSYVSPYIIATAADNSDEMYIMNIKTATLVQYESRGRSISGQYVATQKSLYCLVAVPIQQQLSQLLDLELYEQAISLMNNNTDVSTETQTLLTERFGSVDKLYQQSVLQRLREGRYLQAYQDLLQTHFDFKQLLALYAHILPLPAIATAASLLSEFKLPADGTRQALLALQQYLLAVRQQQAKLQDGDKAQPGEEEKRMDNNDDSATDMQLLDTALLYSCLYTDSPLQWIHTPNSLDATQTIQLLASYQRYSDLVRFYYSKTMHTDALTLLQRWPVHGAEHQQQRISLAVAYLQYLALQPMTHAKLALFVKHAAWVLQADANQGVTIFTHAFQTQKTLTVPLSVAYTTLQKHATLEACITFCESLLNDAHNHSSTWHDQLALLYLQQQRAMQGASPNEQRHTTKHTIVKAKLLSFLEIDMDYDAAALLSYFPCHCMELEERAILLSRLDRHEEVIAIYLRDLDDKDKVNDYCVKISTSQSQAVSRALWLVLLQMHVDDWLTAEHSSQQHMSPERKLRVHSDNTLTAKGGRSMSTPTDTRLDSVLSLLSEHAEYFDIRDVLDVLPNSLTVQQIQPYLLKVVVNNTITSHAATLLNRLSQGKLLLNQIAWRAICALVLDSDDAADELEDGGAKPIQGSMPPIAVE